jgi:hypothetical protein
MRDKDISVSRIHDVIWEAQSHLSWRPHTACSNARIFQSRNVNTNNHFHSLFYVSRPPRVLFLSNPYGYLVVLQPNREHSSLLSGVSEQPVMQPVIQCSLLLVWVSDEPWNAIQMKDLRLSERWLGKLSSFRMWQLSKDVHVRTKSFGSFVFNWVRVIWKESRRLVLTPCGGGLEYLHRSPCES